MKVKCQTKEVKEMVFSDNVTTCTYLPRTGKKATR